MGLFRKSPEEKYVTILETHIGKVAWAIQGLKNPKSRVPSLDKNWEIDTYLNVIVESFKNLSQTEPPLALFVVHRQWLEAIQELRNAAQMMVESIKNDDALLMTASEDAFKHANFIANLAASALQYSKANNHGNPR